MVGNSGYGPERLTSECKTQFHIYCMYAYFSYWGTSLSIRLNFAFDWCLRLSMTLCMIKVSQRWAWVWHIVIVHHWHSLPSCLLCPLWPLSRYPVVTLSLSQSLVRSQSLTLRTTVGAEGRAPAEDRPTHIGAWQRPSRAWGALLVWHLHTQRLVRLLNQKVIRSNLVDTYCRIILWFLALTPRL